MTITKFSQEQSKRNLEVQRKNLDDFRAIFLIWKDFSTNLSNKIESF